MFCSLYLSISYDFILVISTWGINTHKVKSKKKKKKKKASFHIKLEINLFLSYLHFKIKFFLFNFLIFNSSNFFFLYKNYYMLDLSYL